MRFNWEFSFPFNAHFPNIFTSLGDLWEAFQWQAFVCFSQQYPFSLFTTYLDIIFLSCRKMHHSYANYWL